MHITVTSSNSDGQTRSNDGGELKELIELTRLASDELYRATDPTDRDEAKELLAPLMAALFSACDPHCPRLSRPVEGRPVAIRSESLTRLLFIQHADLGATLGLPVGLGQSSGRKGSLLSASKAHWKHSPAYGAHLIALSQLLTGLQKAEELKDSQELSGTARRLFFDQGDQAAAVGAEGAGIVEATLSLDPVDVSFSHDQIDEIKGSRESHLRKLTNWGQLACREVLKAAMRKQGVRFLCRLSAHPAVRYSKLAANVWAVAVHRAVTVAWWC